MKFAVLLCLILAVSVARAEDDAEVATFGGRKARTAWDIISSNPNLSTLAAVIRANNLTGPLDSWRNPVTVFAPTNAALAALVGALPANTSLAGPLVTNILLQHVTASKVKIIGNRRVSVPSLNPGNSITRVFPVGQRHWGGKNSVSSWTGGQRNVVNSTQTLKAIKGSVIVINGVILPNNAFANVQSIAVFYNYTAFAGAVVQAGLLDAANAVAPQKTIFAPNNTAFDAVASVVGGLTQAQVTQVLLYHVAPRVIPTPFTNGTTTTLSDAFTTPLGLVAPSTVQAVGSRAGVITSNIYFPGGVFQGISDVLLPIVL